MSPRDNRDHPAESLTDRTAARYFANADKADEEGLLVVGGQLTLGWLLEAYRHGVFPWPQVVGRFEQLAWYSPDPRAILELDALRLDQRTRQRIRGGQFDFSFDRAFAAVVAGCAGPRKDASGTWITPSLRAAYQRLHERGVAHSIEVWSGGELAGGIYGVALGGYFAGESMFHRKTDASKVALYHLTEHLRQRGYVLFDVQVASPHMRRMGAIDIPRRIFLRRLRDALQRNVSFADRSTAE